MAFKKIIATLLGAFCLGSACACSPSASTPNDETGGAWTERTVVVETARATEISFSALKNKTIKSVKIGGESVEYTFSGETLTLQATSQTAGEETTLTIETASTIKTDKFYELDCLIATLAIDSAEDFKLMRDREHALTDYYAMTADVDFANVDAKAYSPEGQERIFQGTFDGRGYTVKNFNVYWTNICSGLVGSTILGDEATQTYSVVKNFAMIGVNNGGNRTGAVASVLGDYSIIENVFVQGAFVRGGSDAEYGASGYLVGCAEGGSMIKNCLAVDNTSPEEFRGANLGVLVGSAEAKTETNEETGEEEILSFPVFLNTYGVSSSRALVCWFAYDSFMEEYQDGTKTAPYTTLNSVVTDILDNPTKTEKFSLLKRTANGVFWGTAKIA